MIHRKSFPFLHLLPFLLLLLLSLEFLPILPLCFLFHLLPRQTLLAQFLVSFLGIIRTSLLCIPWRRLLRFVGILVEIGFWCAEFAVVGVNSWILCLLSVVPGSPRSVFHKLLEITSDPLQKFGPIQTDLVIIENKVSTIQPILDLFYIFDRNCVDSYMVLVIFVHEGQIEVSHVSCHSLEPNYFDVLDCEHEKMGLCYVDYARFGWL